MDDLSKAELAGTEFGGKLEIDAPTAGRVPLVFASPHSGRDYPSEFLAASRLDPQAIRRSEDSYVDEIFAAAPAHGAPFLKARFPRAFVDPNRQAFELDPAMFDDVLPAHVNTTSARVKAGLGTIARVVADGQPIYRNMLDFREVERRIDDYYRPYHRALNHLVKETRARFGFCILIDCHSMPSAASANGGSDGVDVVLGDNLGRACAPALSQLICDELGDLSFSLRRNRPYSGGFTVHHYGNPERGVHAIQIELNRALYMDEKSLERRPGLADLAARMDKLISALASAAADGLIAA
jgi:N-formylglutamate amidohydrolase